MAASKGTIDRFRAHVACALATAGVGDAEPLVVACSMGPDSLALADALLAVRSVRSIDGHAVVGDSPHLSIVYVDHQLRPESAHEGQLVRELATAHGVEARVVPVVVDRAHPGGLEEAARIARYAALDAVALELGVRWIATGHTASDQAETVLGRLLRGAGPTGLAGIPPVRGRYVRPLLDLGRAEILDYLAARRLTPVQDAMNDDPRFLRTRVRQRLLPALRAENPAIDASLARTAAAMRELHEALEWAADQAAERCGITRSPGMIELDAARLAALPAGVAKRLVQRLARELGSSLEARHLDAVRQLLTAPACGSKGRDLPGLRAIREYDRLLLAQVPEEGVAHDAAVSGPDGPYEVRRFRPGDRMRLGGHSRKLQDLFTDRKIPRRLRAGAVVVVREHDHEVVWAEHIGPAAASHVQVALTPCKPAVINERYEEKSAPPEEDS